MIKYIYLLVLLVICISGKINAQTNNRDSLWLENIISRGGEYQLNEETLEAIRQGRLIDRDIIGNDYIEILPEALRDTSLIRYNPSYGINIYHISPSEVLMYQNLQDSLLIVKTAYLSLPDMIEIKEYIRIPRSRIVVPYTTEMNVYHDSYRNYIMPKPILTFSAEDILQNMFSPVERNKNHNQKNANAWKTYNMQDMNDLYN